MKQLGAIGPGGKAECTPELTALIRQGRNMLFEAMADKDRMLVSHAMTNLELCFLVKARQTMRY